jgi:hypothetical protein
MICYNVHGFDVQEAEKRSLYIDIPAHPEY